MCVHIPKSPPEDIGVPCQQEEFNLNLLAEKLENDQHPTVHHIEELERIPLIRKIAAPAPAPANCVSTVSYGNSMQKPQLS